MSELLTSEEVTMSECILSPNQVSERIGLSRATIYRQEQAGLFPKRLTLSANRVGWLESEVNAWLQKKIDERAA